MWGKGVLRVLRRCWVGEGGGNGGKKGAMPWTSPIHSVHGTTEKISVPPQAGEMILSNPS